MLSPYHTDGKSLSCYHYECMSGSQLEPYSTESLQAGKFSERLRKDDKSSPQGTGTAPSQLPIRCVPDSPSTQEEVCTDIVSAHCPGQVDYFFLLSWNDCGRVLTSENVFEAHGPQGHFDQGKGGNRISGRS